MKITHTFLKKYIEMSDCFYLERQIREVKTIQHKKNPAMQVHEDYTDHIKRCITKCRIVFYLEELIREVGQYNIKKSCGAGS